MKFDNLADGLSYFAKVATDILLMKNPTGTSLGIFTGIVADGIIKLIVGLMGLTKAFSEFGISTLHWIAGGILLFNLPSFWNQHKIPAEIENALQFIEAQEQKGHISKTDAKQKRRLLIDKVLEQVTLKPEIDATLKAVRKVVAEGDEEK